MHGQILLLLRCGLGRGAQMRRRHLLLLLQLIVLLNSLHLACLHLSDLLHEVTLHDGLILVLGLANG